MVRQANRSLLRNVLKNTDNVRIAELVQKTGLSFNTCLTLIRDLVKTGEAVELSPESRGGRPAKRYTYNPNHSLIAAVMLRTTKNAAEIRYSIRNGSGDSLVDGLEPCPAFSLDVLDSLFSRLMQEYPDIKAAALSLPAVIRDGEIQLCDIAGMVGLNLEQHVANKFGLRAIAENNMNLAAVGYYNGNTKSIPTSLAYAAFHQNQSPGMGIVIKGSLFKGKSAFAGEVGLLPGVAANKNDWWRSGDDRELLIKHMAAIAVATIVLINPDVFVFTGPLVTPDLYDPVCEQCLKQIDAQHLPKFVMRSEYEDDCFAGMATMAFASLSDGITLVEKQHQWSGPSS